MILTVDNVEHVYIGARGACRCGCSGYHIYHNTNPMLNEIGYIAINNHGEVDDELFERVIQEINDSPDRVVEEGDFISIETGNELKTAYLRKENEK